MDAIILSGGKSSRMGKNKALLKIAAKTIIESQIEKLNQIFDRVLISANSRDEYEHLGLPIIKDILPHKGSLGGIYSGLLTSESWSIFSVACDMPFLNADVIRHLKSFAQDHDVVIVQTAHGMEPLHAFYSRDCIPHIRKQLEQGNLKIIDFFDKIRLKVISQNELRDIDPSLRWAMNINTKEEYLRAISQMRSGEII